MQEYLKLTVHKKNGCYLKQKILKLGYIKKMIFATKLLFEF